jgi:hypothetical protein
MLLNIVTKGNATLSKPSRQVCPPLPLFGAVGTHTKQSRVWLTDSLHGYLDGNYWPCEKPYRAIEAMLLNLRSSLSPCPGPTLSFHCQFDAVVLDEKYFGAEAYKPLFDYVRRRFNGTSDHILTRDREEHAVYVAACIACDYSVLLEGPAAVGKSTLVMALASTWEGGVRKDGSSRQVVCACATLSADVIVLRC